MSLLPDDSTPLDPEESAGLKPSYISTRAELNAIEALNVEAGLRWATTSRSMEEILRVDFLRELHKRMFGDVWKWAGHYRTSDKNVGVPWWQVGDQVVELLRDVGAWVTGDVLAWPVDEIGTRFHHQLVAIHPFPNGNGRHGRAATDLLIVALGSEPFSWGRENLTDPSEVRSRYVAALQAADHHDLSLLLKFVRS